MKTFSIIFIIMSLFGLNSCVYADSNIKNVETNNLNTTQRVVAYFTSWSTYERNVNISDINPELITHINFAFANLNENGEILIGDSWADIEKPFEGDTWETNEFKGHFKQLNKLKEKHPHIKTLISVGGWTWSNNFSSVASTEERRNNFAKSAVDFITKYNFDGVDIDWEYPVEGGNNIPHLQDDKYNYTKLIKTLRQALDKQEKIDNKDYLITIAGGANQSFVNNTELSEMIKYLDFINIMTYDYHGSWENQANHNAPLYPTQNDNSDMSISNTIDSYINAGISPKDLNIGVAFYGRCWNNITSSENNGLLQNGTAPTSVGYGQGTWESGYFDYWDIDENYINKNNFKRYFDNTARVPYLFDGSTFISYDDEQSIKEKLIYANEKGIGGVMFWEFSGDKNKKLQSVISSYLNKELNIQTTIQENSIESTTDTTTSEKNNESDIKSWSKEEIYTNGDIVIYNGEKFMAKWWTQGEIPNKNDKWGVWELKNE